MDQHRPTPATPRATLTPDYQRDWPQYFEAVADKGPRDTLLRALDAFDREREGFRIPRWRTAIDIGCGEGRDTREMLRRAAGQRWKVMACDNSADGLSRLAESIADRDRPRLLISAAKMEDLPHLYVKGPRPGGRLAKRVDLVNASFALPFCDPAAFPELWAWIRGIMVPGGRLAGQLFGDRDEWRSVRPASHFTRRQVEDLLRGLDIEWLDEVEKEGDDAMGGVKRHHVFHIVARNPTSMP